MCTRLRVLRTITSPSSDRSRSRLRGSRGLPRRTYCRLKSGLGLQVARLQQRQQVVQLQEVVLHGRGGEQEQVAAVQRLTSCQFRVARFLQWWASSTITRSQGAAATASARRWLLANASDASTRSVSAQ